MKRTLLALLLAACSAAKADLVTDMFITHTKDDGPSEVVPVSAATPSPLLTGYVAKIHKCDLLVNGRLWNPSERLSVFMVMHEVGHCKALRAGVTSLDAPDQNVERIADVFALAWVYYNQPGQFDEVAQLIFQHRMSDRRADNRYDTIMAIRHAQITLPSFPGADPWAFTIKMFQQ